MSINTTVLGLQGSQHREVHLHPRTRARPAAGLQGGGNGGAGSGRRRLHRPMRQTSSLHRQLRCSLVLVNRLFPNSSHAYQQIQLGRRVRDSVTRSGTRLFLREGRLTGDLHERLASFACLLLPFQPRRIYTQHPGFRSWCHVTFRQTRRALTAASCGAARSP